MLLIYTPKITTRLNYTFKQVCVRILNIPFEFTTKIEAFIAYDGMKMSYSKKPLGSEIFIQAHELLFETGFADIDINVYQWDDTKCFFKVGEKSNLPYDIFAASFFLLSRYEEYLPHVKDEYGRFPVHESIAYKNNFLKQPVVDIWANKFLEVLQEKYGNLNIDQKTFKFQPVFDIPVAYRYKHKETIRTLAGISKSLVQLDFISIVDRLKVILGFKRDPYDTFKWIINVHKKRRIVPIFFFLLGDYSSFDRSINHKNNHFISLIKSVGDYANLGLKVSYKALDSIVTLKKEKERIEAITNRTLLMSRNSYTKINLPYTYRNLIDVEIKEDISMGYTTALGFRAGTSFPFYFYDLDYEIQTPLKLTPFVIVDHVLLKKATFAEREQLLLNLLDQIKKVNGTFVPIFHNYTFNENEQWKNFRKLYSELLKKIN